MATTTRSSLRQSLSEAIGDFISVDTTANGNAAFTTVISNNFLALDNGTDEGIFEGWYLLIADSGSSANGESRRVEAYIPDPDEPTIRVAVAFSAQIVSGITVELHRYNPTDKHNVLGQALREISGDLKLSVRDETIVVDDQLTDSGMENWTGGVLDSWTLVGSPTVTQETTIVRHGTYSAKVVASGAVGQLTQTPTVNINEITDKTVRVKKLVYATAASTARIRVDFDGSDISNSTYHTGADQWELLEIDVAIPDGATQVKMIGEVADGGTAYFDTGYLSVGPVYEYTMPTSINGGPTHIYQQVNQDIVTDFAPFADGSVPTEGMILRVVGQGILSVPTTDSGTTEIGEPQVRLVIAYAEMLLWRLFASPTRAAGLYRDGYLQAAQEAAGKVAVLKAQKGMVMPRTGAQRHLNSWHMESNATGRIIVFDVSRG